MQGNKIYNWDYGGEMKEKCNVWTRERKKVYNK